MKTDIRELQSIKPDLHVLRYENTGPIGDKFDMIQELQTASEVSASMVENRSIIKQSPWSKPRVPPDNQKCNFEIGEHLGRH